MTHHIDLTNGKAPGATNTEGLYTDTTNDMNFATGTRYSKVIGTQVAKLAMRGHAVHQLKDGGFWFANMATHSTRLTLQNCKHLLVVWGFANERTNHSLWGGPYTRTSLSGGVYAQHRT
jgi:hypothetical protein